MSDVRPQDDLSLSINNFLTCEKHPGRLWNGAHTAEDGPLCPEPDCPGPGMPLLASLAMLDELRSSMHDEFRSDQRPFPVQHDNIPSYPEHVYVPGTTIPWRVAVVVYEGYRARYGTSQSLERLAERGGFGWGEIAAFYPEGRLIMRKRWEDYLRGL